MTDSILWRRLDLPGHEIGRVSLQGDRCELFGTAVFVHERSPCVMDYLVVCDSKWQTKSVRVGGMIGDREINLTVTVDAELRWHVNGEKCAVVAGCIDVDLGFSPSTNLLPIRRLSLDVGEEAVVKAAWLPFPSFEFQVLSQVYRREGEGTYRYESRGGAFVRMLEVNAVGLVTSYPDFWEAET